MRICQNQACVYFCVSYRHVHKVIYTYVYRVRIYSVYIMSVHIHLCTVYMYGVYSVHKYTVYHKQYTVCMCIYIYIHVLTPLETYRFRFFIVFYNDFCCFLPSKVASIFSLIWRLWMLDHHESWCFMCRYNDIFWWYLQRFRLPCCVPNKGF